MADEEEVWRESTTMKWYDIRRVEEGEVGWQFLLVLGLY